MRPLLLKGHEGPIQKVKYNREGDLLFTCAKKDKKPCVWYSDTGERIGNFIGHEGGVQDMDCDFNSTRLLTAGSDRTCKLWDLQTGRELFSFPHASTLRSCGWAEGDSMISTVQDANFGAKASILIYNISADIRDQTDEPCQILTPDLNKRITQALWAPLNTHIISSSDDGCIRRWNVEQGVEELKVDAHNGEIRSMQFSKDRTMIITASRDKTAKLWDTKTLTCLKTYTADRPLNSASISSLLDHVIVGGGQDAMDVTKTSSKSGHFEVDFFHTVFEDFMGSVKGHFGPVNTVAFNPDGRSYASGSEDGYVRVHHFDEAYFKDRYSVKIKDKEDGKDSK
jgi:translation initiation factor 3 subunit I